MKRTAYYLHRDPWEGSHTSYEFAIEFTATDERGPGLNGRQAIEDIEVDSLFESRAWFGELQGGRVMLSEDGLFEDAVLAAFREQYKRSAAIRAAVRRKCEESLAFDCETRDQVARELWG